MSIYSRDDGASAFEAEVRKPEEQLDLAKGALLIARAEYPQLSIDRHLTQLDHLAEEVQDRLSAESAPVVVFREVLDTLFRRRGFAGNRDAYYDPRNSFLSDVLDRRKGIPISLGTVLLEVGWRVGLPLEGVNFPNHFLVRYAGEAIRLLVDPFHGGEIRFEDQAQELLDRVYGGMVPVRPRFLQPATKRDILVRTLGNLKSIYLNIQDHERALGVVERILILRPTSAVQIRDRGTLLARVGRTEEALEQLRWYLQNAPEAADADRIRDLVERISASGSG